MTSRCSAAKPIRNSDCAPTIHRIVASAAESAMYCSRRVLPTPGSPMNTSEPLKPSRTSVGELVEHRALRSPPEEGHGLTPAAVIPIFGQCASPTPLP